MNTRFIMQEGDFIAMRFMGEQQKPDVQDFLRERQDFVSSEEYREGIEYIYFFDRFMRRATVKPFKTDLSCNRTEELLNIMSAAKAPKPNGNILAAAERMLQMVVAREPHCKIIAEWDRIRGNDNFDNYVFDPEQAERNVNEAKREKLRERMIKTERELEEIKEELNQYQ